MTRTVDADSFLLPTSYAARLIVLAQARGVTSAQVLAGTSITHDELADPMARMTILEACRLLLNATTAANDMSIAFELGLSFKASSHGTFGLAMLTSSTLRDAIVVGERFMALHSGPWRIELHVEGATGIMRFVELVDLGPLRQLFLEMMLGGVLALGEYLTGQSFANPAIEFRTDVVGAPHLARFRERMPRVVYGCAVNEGRFPAAWLDRPLALGEPVTNREAVRALEQQSQLMNASDLLDRVRALLADPAHGFPDLDEAAQKLAVSSRTLRRHLAQRNTTFQALRDDARRGHAITLLEQTPLTIEDIGRQLGYAEAAGFVRAFKRWTGEAPGVYRQRRGERGT